VATIPLRLAYPRGGIVNADQDVATAAGRAGPVPAGVTAVVLTHRRPRLAGSVTRSLLEVEGVPADRVVVVVNGDGGLDPADLEQRVHMVRLERNTGPAGGFRAGLEAAFEDPSCRWAYLCEDDVGLFDLPSPRLADVVARVEALGPGRRVGAVVAYGRTFVGRGTHTVNVVPEPGPPGGLTPVDVACWGATLISRQVVEAGVLPDPHWYFGLEDFDFFCRAREAGFEVLVDDDAARRVAGQQTGPGRQRALQASRPTDVDEAWRGYYHARNSMALIRRHGTPGWYGWQLAYAARHLQSAPTRAHRSAIAHGLWDGALGRMGEHPRYRREAGEYDAAGAPRPPAPGS
jgi:rhamnopyranosyl-N-acetylglucosaminyl-diphospho-decaprenol beta-1,3/1,4-galactofuranosyltransferase